ncbi:aa3-type cytochrome c oxidase subunit IV [Lichenihabitans sp. Uapishka_5]|nr:aa3-type cytochrome c oxidase subunit IV [Lichenihabitans sp. Uapishka_5]MDX7950128.1 aa3-type cytochrome c oxidase subunit IV [Lichenihabitans sp. Uapishka_5]
MTDVEQMPMTGGYMDYPEHERTYRGFTAAARWGTIVVAGVIVLMALFLI